MKEFIKDIKGDKIIWYGSFVTIFFVVISIIYLGFIYRFLPPFIPIFNQLPWGVERLGAKVGIFLPFFYMVLIFGTNIILSKMLYNAMPLISRILTITSIIVSITTFIFIFRITQLLL
jgi:antibiotic biosynthesis monooxygenase (ABM) superfamily enzyme